MIDLVATRGLRLRRGGRTVLSDVDFAIRAGEIVTIVGPNGSGKSSLLKAIIGAVKPAAGSVHHKPGLRLGYVPQDLAVDPAMPMTVGRFLDLPLRADRDSRQHALQRAGAQALEHRQLSELSGGQQQRVLLARALLNNPELLLLDEPTKGLDQPGSADFYRMIEGLRDGLGCAILMVSHELHVVMSASDRVICLNGHICCEGRPEVVAQAEAYRSLFGSGTGGALALYRHDHDHSHALGHAHQAGHGAGPESEHIDHRHGPGCSHDHDAESAPVQIQQDGRQGSQQGRQNDGQEHV